MFSQVQQALECLTAALDGVEAAPTGELRQTLGLAKSLRSRVELLETKAASAVAQRERHGDGGAGLLNQVGGRSRSEAARNARLDTELAELPAARTGVSDGEISLANAAKLAQAARKTSPQTVQDDADLVQMAKTLPEDEFAQAAQRWTIRHQSADDLAAPHRRNRRNRHLRFWNGEDGSVQMRGSFDAEMGARIQQRLRQQAEQLRQADRRQKTQSQPSKASFHGSDDGILPGKAMRTRDQRMADALDTLLAGGTVATPPAHVPTRLGEPAGTLKPNHAPHSDGALVTAHGATADDQPQMNPPVSPICDAPVTGRTGDSDIEAALFSPLERAESSATGCNCKTDDAHHAKPDADAEPASNAARTPLVGGKAAEIIVRADLAALTGEPGGIAEICGVGPIPPAP